MPLEIETGEEKVNNVFAEPELGKLLDATVLEVPITVPVIEVVNTSSVKLSTGFNVFNNINPIEEIL